MIIDMAFKPWLLTEPNRNALAGALYDKTAHTLTVTNGKALAVIPVIEDDDDDAGIIPADALKEAAKIGRKAQQVFEIKVRASAATLIDGRSWPLISAQYPNVEQVIPNKTGWTRTARIMLSAELLHDLAGAAGVLGKYGDRSITLEFNTHADGDATREAVLVTAGKSIKAVLMPMRFDSQKDKKASDVPAAKTQEA